MTIQLADIIARVREDLGDEAVSADVILKYTDDGGIIGCLQKASDYLSSVLPDIKQETFTVYECADDDYYVDAEDISSWAGTETCTLTGEDPDVARNVRITITDADYSITAFTLTVAGKDYRGTAQTEVFYWAGGLIQEGEKLFTSITSVTNTTMTGNSTADTLDVGFGKRCYKAFSLPYDSGITTFLDLATCRDAYGLPYFDNAVDFYRAEFDVSTDNSGARNWHNVILRGDELEVLCDDEIEADDTIRIEWGKKHTLNMDSVTVPERLKELLIEGAVGYALRELGELHINRITDGVSVGAMWHNNGLIQISQFKQAVRARVPSGIRQSYSRS